MVQVETDSGLEDIVTLTAHVQHFVTEIIDAFGHAQGRPRRISINSAVSAKGDYFSFSAAWPTPREDAEVLLSLLHPISKDSRKGDAGFCLGRALANAREAKLSGWDTGLFAFRAIESLRQFFVEEKDGSKTLPSWSKMAQSLRIDSGWIEPLRSLSTAHRHGQSRHTPSEERLSAIGMVNDVISRFVAYVESD